MALDLSSLIRPISAFVRGSGAGMTVGQIAASAGRAEGRAARGGPAGLRASGGLGPPGEWARSGLVRAYAPGGSAAAAVTRLAAARGRRPPDGHRVPPRHGRSAIWSARSGMVRPMPRRRSRARITFQLTATNWVQPSTFPPVKTGARDRPSPSTAS